MELKLKTHKGNEECLTAIEKLSQYHSQGPLEETRREAQDR